MKARKLARLILLVPRALLVAPVLLLGLLVALPFMPWPSNTMRTERGTLVIVSRGWFGRWMASRGWGGFTFGGCVLLWCHDNPVMLKHELVHVQQWYTLGLLLIPLYAWEHVRRGYRGNRFETAARAAANQD